MNRPTALVILDGFGISSEEKYNAITQAQIPNLSSWFHCYPHTILQASGQAVGLPEGFQGNSEVGHVAIGAGRIIEQPLTLWNNALQNGSFEKNEKLLNNLKKLLQKNGTLHLFSLLSDAGIHAYENHLYACIDVAIKTGIKKIVIHAFLDGRDTPPQSARDYLKKLELYTKQYNHHVILGSIHGRFYAMDRDHNWQRTETSYRTLTEPQTDEPQSWERILEKNYAHSITDEFVPPTQLTPDAFIKNGDGIIFCNIRPDRARQLTACFVQPHFSAFVTKPLTLSFFITPIKYDIHLPTTHLFERKPIHNTLKDVLANNDKTIFAIAETEKYAHVTYFFRGENEQTVKTETRIMIPSLRVTTYKNNPEMSAAHITDAVLQSLQQKPCDFYLINYANPDMVGHSGDLQATIKAIEFVDKQLNRLYEAIVEKMNGTLYVTADHGKAESMYNEKTHQPQTAHTCNPVPFIMVNQQSKDIVTSLPLSQLADIAPFILKNMNISIPDEMSFDKLRMNG